MTLIMDLNEFKQIRMESNSLFLGIAPVLETGLAQKNMIGNGFLVQSLVIVIPGFMYNHAKNGRRLLVLSHRPAAS